MQTLRMGANAPLDTNYFEVIIEWPAAAGTLDCSAYLLASTGTVRSDDDMIFYNQRSHSTGSVAITRVEEGRTHLLVDLEAVPADVVRIVICGTIEEPGRTMAAFDGTAIIVRCNGEPNLCFSPELNGAREVAMRLGEFYRRDHAWKFRADGQGFNDGLASLARSFGIDVAEDEAAPPREEPETVATPSPPTLTSSSTTGARHASQPAPPGQGGPIPSPEASLKTKDGATSLDRSLGTHRWPAGIHAHLGAVTAKLEWSSQCGGLGGRPRALNLALGCLYELEDGRRGAVQLWDGNGHFDGPPYVQLLAADAAGAGGNQKLRISGEHWSQINRLALYGYIFDGAPSWASATFNLEIAATNREPVLLEMREGVEGCGLVALLLLENNAQDVVFTRLARFVPSHPDLDLDLGWGLSWKVRRL